MRVGILGAGQLGRMLALAGYPLDIQCVLLDPHLGSPASQVSQQIVTDYTDTHSLARLAACEVVTYEFESVPADAAHWLAQRVRVYPPPRALEVAQDRLREKSCFQELEIPTPRFIAVDTFGDLEQAAREIGEPCVLKTRTLGYDGKGQYLLQQPADLQAAWQRLSQVPLIVEEFVQYTRELSLIAVRNASGATAFYPLVENQHQGGILRQSLAPAPGENAALQAHAESYARRLLDWLDYVGVLTLELFEVGGELLANEIAPRVHNSGHWTIEGAEISQFENHLRAILGLPLGGTRPTSYAAMLNLIGILPDSSRILAIPGAHLHLYGKEPRAGRKLGHVTLCCESHAARCERLNALTALVPE